MLQRLTNGDFSNDAFRFMRSRRIDVSGIECVAIRVSFTGDLGWELHCDEKHHVQLYTALLEAAKGFNGGPVGGRALSSLRIEKGYGSWGREYSTEYWPQEVGLERLIKLDKDFLNKDAYLRVKDNTPRERLSIIAIDAVNGADASGGEPIFLADGTPAGRITSGAYGYSVDKSLALGFIKEDLLAKADKLMVPLLGIDHDAVLLKEPPFDAAGVKLRN